MHRRLYVTVPSWCRSHEPCRLLKTPNSLILLCLGKEVADWLDPCWAKISKKLYRVIDVHHCVMMLLVLFNCVCLPRECPTQNLLVTTGVCGLPLVGTFCFLCRRMGLYPSVGSRFRSWLQGRLSSNIGFSRITSCGKVNLFGRRGSGLVLLWVLNLRGTRCASHSASWTGVRKVKLCL